MNNQNYGESFYKQQYEILAKAMRQRDLKIVELQKECEGLQCELDDLAIFKNFLFTTQQFFGLMFKPHKKLK